MQNFSINSLVVPMLKPDMFGWYHMMWLFISAISVVFILIFTSRKNIEKQTKIFLIVFATFMYIGEIHKQIVYGLHGEYGSNFVPHFPWETVPLHFCGTPLYVVPIALLAKNKKVKEASLTYLATFAFIGGIGAMLFPGEAYRDRLGNNIQTMVHHYFMIIFATFMWRTGQVKSFKSFLRATYMFMIFLTCAVLLNTVFNGISQGVINVFYLNPYQNDPGIIPVISKLVANQDTYVLGLLLYIFAFFTAALILFGVGKYLNRIIDFIKSKTKLAFDVNIGYYIIVGLFLIGTVIFPRLMYNNYFFPTVDFAKISFGTWMNSLFSDLFYFIICLVIINTLFKKRLYKTIAIIVLLFFANFLVFAQMTISYHYNLLISFDTLTVMKNPADEMGWVMTANFLQLLFERSWHLAFLPFEVVLVYAIVYMLRNKILFVNDLGSRKLQDTNTIHDKCAVLNNIKSKTFSFFGFITLLSLFGICQGVGRNYVNYNWQVSASRQTIELQSSGYTAGFASGAILGNSHQDNEKVDYDFLKQFNRNPHNTNRIDGYGNSISSNLSGITSPGVSDLNDLKNIFKDRNIFLIQLETFPSFMLGEEKDHIFNNYKETIYPNITKLLKQSYFLENFYDSTGVGHTMDALFAVHMGLPMPGADTLCWRHNNNKIVNDNILSKHLARHNYQSLAYMPSTLEFYNTGTCFNEVLGYDNLLYADPKRHNPSHAIRQDLFTLPISENLIGTDFKTHLFNQYQYEKLIKDDLEYQQDFTKLPRKYFLDDKKYEQNVKDFDTLREKYIKQQWGIDDRLGFKILAHLIKNNQGINSDEKKLLAYYSTALPHIPFAKMREEDKPFGDEKLSKIVREKGKPMYIKQNTISRPLDEKGNPMPSVFHDNLNKMYRSDYNCVQSIGYHDRAIKYFIEYTLPVVKNSVFIFYGDHTATSFRKKSMELLYNRKMTRAEYRSRMKRTAAWVYVPDETQFPVEGVFPGLVVGKQTKLRSEHDIKDTILELIGIENNNFSLYHNLFTTDNEVYVEPKTMSVFTDDFLAQSLNKKRKNVTNLTKNYSYEEIQEIITKYQKLKYELEKVLLIGNFTELNNLK